MNWKTILIIALSLGVVIALKQSGRISRQATLAYLKRVIDARTPGKFNAGHLPTAINLPLDEIETALPLRVTNKSQVLMLHCQSGMRSGMAKSKLRSMGYTHAFNLGS